MDSDEYFEKIKEIPNILINNKWYIAILILIITIFLIGFPIDTKVENNITSYHSLVDLGIADYGFSSAIIVGLLGFLATIYTNDKNLKLTKLSIIPETLSVKTELENQLISYYQNQKYHPPDQILLLIDILHVKSEYETIFRLLAPNSYKRLQYLFMELFEDWNESDEIPETNAKNIMNEILWSIANEEYHIEEDGREIRDYEYLSYIEAKKRCKNEFQYIINDAMPLTNLSDCSDDIEHEKNLEDVEYCMNTQQILDYIDTIPANKTKKLTLKKFENITNILDEIFKGLEKELSHFEV